jgi:hypothetical protein
VIGSGATSIDIIAYDNGVFLDGKTAKFHDSVERSIRRARRSDRGQPRKLWPRAVRIERVGLNPFAGGDRLIL